MTGYAWRVPEPARGRKDRSVKNIRLAVEAVALDWRGNPIVVLRETDGHRAVFIWVGISEATSISMQLESQSAPRPLTHDLLMTVLHEMAVTVEQVTISDMRGATYYAELTLNDGEESITLDCRPSDAIALALRAKAPILIGDDLLDRLDQARKDSGVELSPGSTLVEPNDPTVH